MGSSNATAQTTSHTSLNYQLGLELADKAQAIVGDGNTVVNTTTDFEAVDRAFDFADGALDDNKAVISAGFNAIGSAFDKVLGVVENTSRDAYAFANNASKSDNAQSLDKISGYIPLVIVLGGIGYIFKD
mgnify:CR=1 FL=1